MPQVSADSHVAVPPETARRVADGLGPVRLRLPPHVRPSGPRWRFDPEGEGTCVVLVYPYAVRPAWVRPLTHEVTQWALARQARRWVAAVVAGCLSTARPT
ncbi:hypothetical protein N865_08305 [Intrasporangium oryzae NRRL B-24470]|uniref:Uncharacterized protein n=1 Tax=Intrasporangium oryzae NRRL B-24470 TaxID=1386089 RepID=W9G1G3_9MICO|nr:hypothetical protein [Intrasporangium oryzae]EWS99789.1 hypothetical protein N865_08305 [Intrasporangium oryzae NRRL B-24470]